MSERFFTLKQASAYLGISLSTIYKMSHAEKLPGKIRFGLGEKPRNVRVDRQALEAFIKNQAEGNNDQL